MTKLFNRSQDLEKRRQLRRNTTPAEKLLWECLRDRKLLGYKFRRQYGIDRFVVDFYCPAAHLAIELDGPIHDQPDIYQHDIQRQAYLTSQGIQFLRFSNQQVAHDLTSVLNQISTVLSVFSEVSVAQEPHP